MLRADGAVTHCTGASASGAYTFRSSSETTPGRHANSTSGLMRSFAGCAMRDLGGSGDGCGQRLRIIETACAAEQPC